MFRLYVWVDGRSFDPARFRELHGGEVASRKRMRDGLVETYGQYWRSAEISRVPAIRVDDELRVLLQRLSRALSTIPNDEGARVVVEVVQEYRNSDSVAGLFLSAETLSLVAGVHASLDYDVVRDLS
jgi:hypothetical protein